LVRKTQAVTVEQNFKKLISAGKRFPIHYLVSLPLILQIWFIAEDTWDGLITRYAIELGDFSGYFIGLDESGWEAGRLIINLELWLATLTSTDYFVGYKIIISVGLLLLTRETYLLLRSTFKTGKFWATIGVALTLTNPVWTAASGSAMIVHLWAIPAALIGVRLLMKSDWKFLFSIPFLLIAFELDSMLLFAPALALVYSLLGSTGTRIQFKSTLKSLPILKTFVVLLAAVAHYILSRILNPTFGRYETYNALVDPVSIGNVSSIGKSLIWFAILLVPALFSLLFVLLVSNGNKTLESFRERISRNQITVISLAILLLASSAPYIFVSKSPIFFEIYDWQGRHGFAFSVALAAFTVVLLQLAVPKSSRQTQRLAEYVAIFLVTLQLGVLSLGFAYKYESIEFDNRLVSELSRTLPSVPEGYLVFDFYGQALPAHAPYGSIQIQYLTYEAMGKPNWRSTDDVFAHKTPMDSALLTPESRLRDIYSGDSRDCTTQLLVVGRGWGQPFGYYLQSVFSSEPKQLAVHIMKVDCIK
jgi:hypothetical protein